MAKPIFTLDEDAVKTLEDNGFNLTVKPKGKPEYTLGVGTEFAVVSRDNLEVRATMIDPDSGKPKRGRPRRFPATLVARLLGEDDFESQEKETQTVVDVLVDEPELLLEEDHEEIAERHEAAIVDMFESLVGDEVDF